MTERSDRESNIFDAISVSSKTGIVVAAAYEAGDMARVEAEQAARAKMLSYLRSDEVKFVNKANEGFGKKPYGVRGESYIAASLDSEEYLAAVHSRSKLALWIPDGRIFVVTKPSDNALAEWKASVETQFGGGVHTAEEMMRRNFVIAVNPNSGGFRDHFMNQLVQLNEEYFKK